MQLKVDELLVRTNTNIIYCDNRQSMINLKITRDELLTGGKLCFYDPEGNNPVYLLDKKINYHFTKCSDDENTVSPIVIPNANWETLSESLMGIGRKPLIDFFPLWFLEILTEEQMIDYNALIRIAEVEKKELSEYLNFIKRRYKIATVFGNCQVQNVLELLQSNESFSNQYILITMPFVQSFGTKEKNEGLNESILRELSLFIYQPVTKNNRYSEKISTDYIKTKLSDECVKLSIQNIFFTGYFPQINEPTCIKFKGSKYDGNGLFPFSDHVVEQLIKKGLSDEEIIQKINSGDVITKESILSNLNDNIEELRRRDKGLDVTITDYIVENYRKKRIVHMHNHPTIETMAVLVNRILQTIKIDSQISNAEINVHENDCIREPIYPVVYRTLKLEFDIDGNDYFQKKFDDQQRPLKDYIRLYRNVCFPETTQRSLDWFYQNLPRSIDLSSEVKCDAAFVRFRDRPVMTLNGGTVHLSLYLDIKKEVRNEPVISFPVEYSPESPFFTTASASYGINYPAKVGPGVIRFKLPLSKHNVVVIIDTTWNISSLK